MIVEYIMGVSYPTWFAYKLWNNWVQGAPICLEQLQLTLLQRKRVVNIVFPYLESSAWWAHPEMLLQSLLCSEVEEDRCFAVDLILQERQQDREQLVRTRHKVHLNRAASSLRDLIHWDWEGKKFPISEPVLTRDLPEDALVDFKEKPMEVAKYPVHGQSVERAVKEVTKAAMAVFGAESRDGWVRARLAHRMMTGGVVK